MRPLTSCARQMDCGNHSPLTVTAPSILVHSRWPVDSTVGFEFQGSSAFAVPALTRVQLRSIQEVGVQEQPSLSPIRRLTSDGYGGPRQQLYWASDNSIHPLPSGDVSLIARNQYGIGRGLTTGPWGMSTPYSHSRRGSGLVESFSAFVRLSGRELYRSVAAFSFHHR